MAANVNLPAPLAQQFRDNAGNLVPGGLLFCYAAGTSTKQAVYTDSTGTVAMPNPIVLDATGSATFWPDTSLTYKYVLAPSTDTDPPTSPIWTRDGVATPANTTQAAAAAAAGAQPYVTAASNSANAAAGSASAASASATTAGNYATAAATGAKFFNTIALGNAGVADGATFGVVAGGSDGLTRPTVYQRVSAGVSTLLYGVLPASEYDALFPQLDGATPVWGVNGDKGLTALEVESDGTTKVANLVPLQLNGLDQRYRLQPASLGNFDAERVVFILDGQSNAQGRSPPVTTTVEYDNIGFAQQASSPVSYSALTAQNCAFAGVQEPLLFGALGYIKKLILWEHGLDQNAIKYQLLGADNSQGSTAISAHAKGSQYYGYGTSQAQSAVTLSASDGVSLIHGGVFWNQGEADSATALATYQTAMQTLATNYNTDLKAITGQTKDITFLTAQTTSTTANRNIALAQLGAALSLSLVKVVCPMYQFDYESDGIHVIQRHDYWMGAYYGLAWKRLWVDQVAWKPVRPTSVVTSGNTSYVTFDCMVQPLVLDTTSVPAQTNYGFSLSSGHAINSVSVVRPNVVKIVGASALAGDTLQYGFGAATGKGGYTGAAGNLRDSQGNCVISPDPMGSFAMHNWCLVSTIGL